MWAARCLALYTDIYFFSLSFGLLLLSWILFDKNHPPKKRKRGGKWNPSCHLNPSFFVIPPPYRLCSFVLPPVCAGRLFSIQPDDNDIIYISIMVRRADVYQFFTELEGRTRIKEARNIFFPQWISFSLTTKWASLSGCGCADRLTYTERRNSIPTLLLPPSTYVAVVVVVVDVVNFLAQCRIFGLGFFEERMMTYKKKRAEEKMKETKNVLVEGYRR